MSDISQTGLRDTVVDFTYPHLFTRMSFFTKKPPTLPKIMALVLPYEKRVWICLAVGLASVNLINCIVSKVYHHSFTPSFNLSKVMLQVCEKLMMKGKI